MCCASATLLLSSFNTSIFVDVGSLDCSSSSLPSGSRVTSSNNPSIIFSVHLFYSFSFRFSALCESLLRHAFLTLLLALSVFALLVNVMVCSLSIGTVVVGFNLFVAATSCWRNDSPISVNILSLVWISFVLLLLLVV